MYSCEPEYRNYRTPGFTEIFPDVDSFLNEYKKTPIGLQKLKEENVKVLYFLLFGRYGNSPIASNDKTVFKYKMYMIMFTDGPIWEKKLEIQDAIRNLDLNSNELIEGGRAIYNSARNDSSSLPNSENSELPFVDSQNTTRYLKSKLDGYERLYNMIDVDFTKSFLEKFKVLFVKLIPDETLLYCEGGSENE